MIGAALLKRRIAALGRSLAEERGLIRTGALRDLAEMTARREAALAALEGARPEDLARNADAIESLKREAARNLALLAAARKGFRAARQALAGAEAETRKLGVYDASGAQRPAPAIPNRDKRF